MRRVMKSAITVFAFSALLVETVSLPGCCITTPPIPHAPSRVYLTVDAEALLIGEMAGAETPVESLPFYLRFDIRLQDSTEGHCGAVSTPEYLSQLKLKELRYELSDQNGTSFFNDTVVLYGSHGPGTLTVQPGMTMPERSESISIQTELSYDELSFDKDCNMVPAETTANPGQSYSDKVLIDIRSIPDGAQYARISSSYRRRHLLRQGRNLSATWLKEFDAARDRKELLNHSRTLRLSEDDRTRVFVPWVFECDQRPPLPLGEGKQETGCGKSIHPSSVSVYAGGENPLLRGGLAMAAFALEARRHFEDTSHDMDERRRLAENSLRSAMLLLNHVEASEWRGTNGRPTGFFLRADRPGKLDGGTDRAYMFASIDELSGMLVGLKRLHETLELLDDTSNARRIEGLVHRLGTQLKENHYFILPYHRVAEKVTVKIGGTVFWATNTPRWRPIGLPPERQRGWNGPYGFEWFLNRSFSGITGNRYDPPSKTSPVYIDQNVDISLPEAVSRYADEIREHFHIPSWVPVDRILSLIPDGTILNFIRSNTVIDDWVPANLIATEAELFSRAFRAAEDKTDDASSELDRGMAFVLSQNHSAYDRAIYAIQALGILSYYDATDSRRYPLCQHLEQQNFLPPNTCIAALLAPAVTTLFRQINQLFFSSYFPLPDPMDSASISEGIEMEASYWNNPMLMHVFQAADPISNSADTEVSGIRREMAKFIKGMLVNGGVETQVELDKLVPEEGIPFADIPDIFRELVGRPDRDPDYYAAAIARMFDLPSEFSNASDRDDFEEGIQWAIQTIESNYATSAPIAEPHLGYCTGSLDTVCTASDCKNNTPPNTPCNRCDGNGTCNMDDWAPLLTPFQPASFSAGDMIPFGKGFIWERRPRSGVRHMKADGFGGIVLDEISTLYRRGENDLKSRYTLLNEGAGVGFLLPFAMLNRPVSGYYYAHVPLPACYTNPVLEAKDEVAPLAECRLWFEKMTPDSYDQRSCQGGSQTGNTCTTDFECLNGGTCQGIRNDSFYGAAELAIGSHVQLSIDRSTDSSYSVYATFNPEHGEIYEVLAEMDYDFFYIDNPTSEDVGITMTYLYHPRSIINRLYIDGEEARQDDLPPCPGPDPCLREVSGVSGGMSRPTIMIMGDVGNYDLSIESVSD